jgi:hypothetical protein
MYDADQVVRDFGYEKEFSKHDSKQYIVNWDTMITVLENIRIENNEDLLSFITGGNKESIEDIDTEIEDMLDSVIDKKSIDIYEWGFNNQDIVSSFIKDHANLGLIGIIRLAQREQFRHEIKKAFYALEDYLLKKRNMRNQDSKQQN